jgi:type IX secretion system PorP/SprF family membrane protein
VSVLFSVSDIKAQQDPHYSQFMYNKLTYNAGYAGATDGKICVTLLNRQQWMGFGGGQTATGLQRGDAPSNLVGSINAAIGSRFGIGATIVKDELGFETMLMPRLTLAYRQPMGDDGVLAGGVGVGSMQRTLDGAKLKALDPNDPKIPNAAVSGTAIDLDFGLYYTKTNLAGIIDDFYAGVSATHLNQNTITYSWDNNTSTVNSKMHYYLTAGGTYQLGGNLALQPNIIVKKDPAKIQTDLNCFLVMNQNIRGGLTWRPMDAAVLLVGYEFPFGLNVGYSYDITTSRIINYSSGSHEIMIRYCFGVKIPHNPPIIRSRYTPRFM